MKRTLLLVLSLSFLYSYAQESKELAKLKQQTGANVTISKSTSNPNFIRFKNAEGLQLKEQALRQKSRTF